MQPYYSLLAFNRRSVWLALCFVAAIPFVVSIGGCGQADRSTAVPMKKEGLRHITVGIQVSPAMALVMVAKDKNLFETIDVEIKEFTAGKFALQAFLSRSIDFCVSGEVPVCLATLQGNEIRVVSQVVERTVNEVRTVARRDGNLISPSEYFGAKKRRLATSFGGGPEFYTYSFLKHHGIASDQVELISQKPEDMPAALAAASIDAIAVFDPFAYIAEKRLGTDHITFKDDAIYSELYVLNARPEQVAGDGTVVRELVKGLARASVFIEKNPEEAKSIVRRYTKLDQEVIDGIWDNFVFRPALTPELVKAWEAQAAWAVETGKVPSGSKVPDFRRVVDNRFLEGAE